MVLKKLMEYFKKFEVWFNREWGWFFTNGMKDRGRNK